MRKLFLFTFLVAAFGFATPLQADRNTPPLNCREPKIPAEFTDDGHRAHFNMMYESYQTCMQDYIRKQTNEYEIHKKAADNASAQWKAFLKKAEKVFE